MDERTRHLILSYSEWLDSDQQLLTAPDGDERTHDELITQWADQLVHHVYCNGDGHPDCLRCATAQPTTV